MWDKIMLWEFLIIIAGLTLFEVVNSVDNAIINAHVLKTMGEKWRRRFLFVGILTSVFLVRIILPVVIVFLVIPNIAFSDLVSMILGKSTAASAAIEHGKPLILMFGGVFLLLLYFHWLFMEKKLHLFHHEKLFREGKNIWFFALAAILLVGLMYFARFDVNLMLFAAIGSATFFIVYGFKETAEKEERKLMKGNMSDVSKFVYLEVLDTAFSFDGVVGAFAFTTNLPLIFIGLGIGALVVREMTIRGINVVSKYKFLKNGAMTSIAFLGAFMIFESFGIELPAYLPTLITVLSVGYAFWISHKHIKLSLN